MIRRLISNKTVVVCLFILTAICLMGAFAPFLAPHDPNLADVINSMMPMSIEYPLGTDHLGRCIYSRLLFGIRTTLYYSLLTMVITAIVGGFIGVVSGYMRGKVDSLIMRACEVMLSFPYEIIVLSIVGIMGPGIFNIIIANFIAKIAWYVRIVRSSVISFNHQNYILYSRTVKTPRSYIFRKHLAPNIAAEVIILATLDLGWIILSISTLSFLGLGVQPPTAEWGAMLSDAKEVLFSNPEQMVIPGIAIMVVVACCNLLGDSLRDVLDPRTEQR
ncbi:nickel/cobalt ABC transporter permease [Vibrio splendidus]|uniref:nickel/cobalt ABC transporter permease n=1 Tax=Vibrio splendidus TaxID=29497 RepID=UPI000C843A74|nr:nickel/cobalt ABC transporter permease [Vibrio splendidus]PMI82747.1 nickel ABC transporter permease subunit NikC [Vibrio splendidus]PMK59956.1 nickel ABC transporter permease subunit NikC [Vibrio splendidus]